jgi:hypothetical protein
MYYRGWLTGYWNLSVGHNTRFYGPFRSTRASGDKRSKNRLMNDANSGE